MLSEERRLQLDGIVQQATNNGETDNKIQFIVDDFKSIYDKPEEGLAGQVEGEALGFAGRVAAAPFKGVFEGAKEFGTLPERVEEQRLAGIEKQETAKQLLTTGVPEGPKTQEQQVISTGIVQGIDKLKSFLPLPLRIGITEGEQILEKTPQRQKEIATGIATGAVGIAQESTIGSVVLGAFETLGMAGLKTIGKTLFELGSDEDQEVLMDLGKQIAQAKEVETAGQFIKDFQQAEPLLAQNLDNALTTSELIPAGALLKPGTAIIKKAAKELVDLPTRVFKPSEKKIISGLNKAITPLQRVRGGKVVRSQEKIDEQWSVIVDDLKKRGEQPQSLKEFKNSMEQGQERIFKDVINPALEESKIKIGLSEIANNVEGRISSKAKTLAPAEFKQVENLLERLRTTDLQDIDMKELEAWKQEINALTDWSATGTEKVYNNALKDLSFEIGDFQENIFSNLEGQGIKNLKRTYGAYADMLGDVNKSIIKYERKAPVGLFSGLGRLAGIGNLVESAVKGDIAGALKGTAQIVTGEVIKNVNDANNIIKRSFKGLGKEASEIETKPLKNDIPNNNSANLTKDNLPTPKDTGGAEKVKNFGKGFTEGFTQKPKGLKSDITGGLATRVGQGIEGGIRAVKKNPKTVTVFQGRKGLGSEKKFPLNYFAETEQVAKSYGPNVTKNTIKLENLADFTKPNEELKQLLITNYQKSLKKEGLAEFYVNKALTADSIGGTPLFEIIEDVNVTKALKEAGFDAVKFGDFGGKNLDFKKHNTIALLNIKKKAESLKTKGKRILVGEDGKDIKLEKQESEYLDSLEIDGPLTNTQKIKIINQLRGQTRID